MKTIAKKNDEDFKKYCDEKYLAVLYGFSVIMSSDAIKHECNKDILLKAFREVAKNMIMSFE